MDIPLNSNPRWTPGRLLVLLVLLCVGAGPVLGAEPARVNLPGHVPAMVPHLTALGRLPETNRLTLSLGLPLRNEAALDKLLQQLYDPKSTNYHRFLTPTEFAARFGPTEAEYAAVMGFAESNGLTVTGRHTSRMVLDVSGGAGSIGRAFQVTLRTYRHPTERRNFYAPDTEPSVPTNVPVADMWGLSDYGPPKPLVRPMDRTRARPANDNGSGPGGTYEGSDFRNAYAPGASEVGSGQTAAVAEFDGYYANDITTYESQIGYTNVPLQNILLDFVSGTPGYSGQADAPIEVSLDIEMLIAMAPALNEVLVYEGTSPYDVFDRILTDNLAKQISCSWTWGYGPTHSWTGGRHSSNTLDSLLKQLAAQGQSFFQASGDGDAYTGNQALSTSFGPIPVDSIYVTSVGGTSLTMNGTGASWASETVWNWGLDQGAYVGSSGGISPNYTIPNWQTNANPAAAGGSSTYRNVPDVALTADAVHIMANNGVAENVGGTSCAAPLWAGFCALINQQAVAEGGATNTVGFLNPALYAVAAGTNYAACFHDITTGNNIWTNTPNLFSAGTGYDLCTGLGTPGGTNLINALAPPAPQIVGPPASQSVTNGGSVTLGVTAHGLAPFGYGWLYDGTPLAATNAVTATASTLTLTNVTAANAGSYSVVVTNAYGSVTSIVAALTVLLPPVITNQPAGQLVLLGGNMQFSVSASGTANLYYQWWKNGTKMTNGTGIAGATTNLLSLTVVGTNSGGNYLVVVTNLYGMATSSVAALTVYLPGTITTPPAGETVDCSSNVAFTAVVAGWPPPACQWSLDGTALAGATNMSLLLTNVHMPNHTVSVVVTNLYGGATNSVTLAVQNTNLPAIALNGGNPIYVELGTTFTDPGATAQDACSGTLGVTVIGTVNTNVLGTNSLFYVALDDGNSNSMTRLVIVCDTTPPTIEWSFTNLVLAAGSNCEAVTPVLTGTNFILAADLSGPPVITQNPGTNVMLSLGTNRVILTATDTSGNAAYSTNVIVVVDETAPVLLWQPQSQTNTAGGTVSFSLTATACTPLSYQWYFDRVAISGQTNTVLTMPGVGLTNAGCYAAMAMASGGSSTSAIAVLTVALPPVIEWSFTNLVLAAGSNCEAVMPDITGTNFIQATVWSGVPIITQIPATNTALPVGSNYVVQAVEDSLGNLVYASNVIVVADETAPVLVGQPQSQTNTVGGKASFSLTATACSPLSYQWYFDSAAILGQTNDSLTLAPVNFTNAGSYFVTATAAGGSSTSAVVNLTVVLADTPLVLSVLQNPGGGVVLNLSGPPEATSILEMTTNLGMVNCWQILNTNVLDNGGAAQFIDYSAANDTQRFYRALLGGE